MGQHEAIVQYLKAHPEGITPMDAFHTLHITKLATRVSELIRAGFPIVKKPEAVRHEDGTTVRYTRYTLEVLA